MDVSFLQISFFVNSFFLSFFLSCLVDTEIVFCCCIPVEAQCEFFTTYLYTKKLSIAPGQRT